MTEHEWQQCADPRPMLEFLEGTSRDRQRRLFAAACGRMLLAFAKPNALTQSWRIIPAEGRAALTTGVELAERSAAGPVDDRLWELCRTVYDENRNPTWGWDVENVLQSVRGEDSVSGLCDPLPRLFTRHFAATCVAAAEFSRQAAWASWEAMEGTQTSYWQVMQAKWEEEHEELTRNDNHEALRWLDKHSLIEYAERHGYQGREGWQSRWDTVWSATWDDVWDRRWPPFSWQSSHAHVGLEPWEREIFAERWRRFEQSAADLEWKEGRHSPQDDSMHVLVHDLLRVETGIHDWEEACEAWVRREMVHLVTEVFGEPFRPITFGPQWRTSTVHALAQIIYAERAFDRMPTLADALQDAGCECTDVLEHCRGPGPHVRGCWVIDLLLGKV